MLPQRRRRRHRRDRLRRPPRSPSPRRLLMYRWLLCVGCVLLLVVGLTRAWWVEGHASVAEGAASVLPDEMPAFFRAGAKPLGHYAGDPDRWKNPSCKFL